MSSSAFTPSTTTVTNNVPVNVPVVTAGELYTPTAFGFTYGSNGIEWTRQGDLIFIKGRFTTSATSGAASLSLPLNLTARTPGGLDVFCGKWVRSTAATNQAKQGNLYAVNGQSRIYFALDDYTLGQSPLNNMSATNWGGAGEVLSFEFTVAISEWSGSGTTTLATRAVEEYASNTTGEGATNGSTYSNSAFFRNGPEGSKFPNIGTVDTTVGSTKYYIQWQSPQLATDNIIIEMRYPGLNTWTPVTEFPQMRMGSSQYGISYVATSATQGYVQFGRAGSLPAGASYGATGNAWNNFYSATDSLSYYWRVRKVSSGAQVGYPVSARNIVGDTSGSVVPVGMLGESLTALCTSGGSTSIAGTYVDQNATLTLQPGIWLISVLNSVAISIGSSSVSTIAGNTALRTSGNTVIASYFCQHTQGIANSVVNTITTHSFSAIVNIASPTSYKLSVICNASAGASGGTLTFYVDGTNAGSGTFTVNRMTATRIA